MTRLECHFFAPQVYHEIVTTARVFVRDATLVGAYPLLLLAGEVSVDHERRAVSVDGWLRFAAPPRTAVLMRELRAEINELFMQKVKDPERDLDELGSGKVLAAIVRLLESEEEEARGEQQAGAGAPRAVAPQQPRRLPLPATAAAAGGGVEEEGRGS